MNEQMQNIEEANTPEINQLSLLMGTIDLSESIARQKQEKAKRRAAKLRQVKELSPEDVSHREDYWDFIKRHSAPWHQQHLLRIVDLWEEWNREYFESKLVLPYILLLEPAASNVLGDCSSVSGFGGRSQIRLRPSLLLGTHPKIKRGKSYAEGRFLYVADVALHETIHQWQQEVTGNHDDGYHGHGPSFRDKANEIGAKLGFPMVRTSKKRGKDRNLPSCSRWPHNVRPVEYYQGADCPSGGDFFSTQALCAAAARYAEKPTNESLLELGRVAVAYHARLEAKQAGRVLLRDEEEGMSLVVGTNA